MHSHSDDIRDHDPVGSINEHPPHPVEECGRLNSGDECEIREDHEPGYVMSPGTRLDIAHRGSDAIHLRPARILEEGEERTVGGETGHRSILITEDPINTVDVFTPPDDLTDEALARRDRDAAALESCDRSFDDLGRVQKPDVQVRREQRVVNRPAV